MIYKLRPSVAVVEKENGIEFFLSNIRKIVFLKGLKNIKSFLFKFDGKKDFNQILAEEKIYDEEIKIDSENLIKYLNEQNIMIKIDDEYNKSYETHHRTYTLLEDYHNSISKVNDSFKKIENSTVMIIGLGAVGTWVAHNLVMSGVKNLILVDFDKIESSNLHRQIGYFENDIGKLKIDALESRLLEIEDSLNIKKIDDKLDNDFFNRNTVTGINLIINCSDYPNVDETSRIIGEYCMKNDIAHLIGGGYNLHLSLIGQIVIPNKTACVKCFEKELEDLNKIDVKNIKKLENKDRKIGSFTPLTSISASITSNEAIKYLSEVNNFVMIENRSEFILREMNFKNLKMNRRKDCEWCGKEGKFYKL